MSTSKYTIVIVIMVLGLTAAITFAFQAKTNKAKASFAFKVENIWELPDELREVSGIAWLDANTMAAVQDEDGVIFIYDLKQKNILEQIHFAGAGDYEGIAIHNEDAYVMRSDGLVYEVSRFREPLSSSGTGGKKISTFKTHFSDKNNVETLTVDPKNKCLVVVPKDRDRSDYFKGLYQIPLDSKIMNAEPIIKINMNDVVFENHKKKKIYQTFRPADLAIHPITGEYYVLEATNPKLVVLDSKGSIKKVHDLDKDTFAQPEGITFSPDGTIYISNEAGDKAANIMEVSFK